VILPSPFVEHFLIMLESWEAEEEFLARCRVQNLEARQGAVLIWLAARTSPFVSRDVDEASPLIRKERSLAVSAGSAAAHSESRTAVLVRSYPTSPAPENPRLPDKWPVVGAKQTCRLRCLKTWFSARRLVLATRVAAAMRLRLDR
jgi:hypothetical protein